MKIAVCGVNNSEVFKLLKKLESHYNVKYVSATGNIYESAKVTYDYDDVDNVVFEGCMLDYAVNEKYMHLLDEQIILCAFDNLDVVYLCTSGMTEEEICRYHQFDEFYSGKVVDVINSDEFSI